MEKVIKILLVISIFSLVLFSLCSVYASDVNMNLTTNDNTTYGSTTNNTNNINNNQSSSVVVSDAPSFTLDSLSLSDMINIVLCAIGMILILLGIAILIRQKTQ